jgi:hypothetical protein
MFVVALAIVFLINLLHPADAASPSLEGRLIGAMVYSADGVMVGEVMDVATAEDGSLLALRVKTGSPLGFGERIVMLPHGTFRVLRKGILLEFSAETMGSLPSISTETDAAERN